MADIPAAAQEHYAEVQRLQVLALAASRRSWARLSTGDLSRSWESAMGDLLPVIEGVQLHAATSALTYGAFALAEQGTWVAPEMWVDPRAFVGQASYGDPLDSALYGAVPTTKRAIEAGHPVRQALAIGGQYLDTLVRTLVADTARKAASVDVAVRPGVGYVRMLNPPSCDRCVVLAGRFYRWNAGFRRHLGCDCVHCHSTAGSTQAARDEGLVDDPYDYFRSLTDIEQDKIFGKGYSDAIRDGGDIYQVVNSKRGRSMITTAGGARRVRGSFTTEGAWSGHAAGALRPNQRRMTPETIYRLADGDRSKAIQALRDQGYILPGGQVPGGSLRGRVEGFGQMGRGGARKAAREAITDGRRTGVRDPNNRYTMTAAERRLYDAEQRYRSILEGISPSSSPAFTNIPDPAGLRLSYGRSSASGALRPVTPIEAASAEANYRRWLTTAGQKF